MNALPRLVLVEDNKDNSELVEAYLDGRYQLVIFSTGHEALRALRASTGKPPNLFLLDISLPEMTGQQLLKELRQTSEFKAVPAIALTAHAGSEDRRQLLGMGFNAFLSKPICEEDLLTAISKLIALT